MTGVELRGLSGRNPLGYLAALGVLDALHRAGRDPRMSWSGDLVPTPTVTGVDSIDDLVTLLVDDLAMWSASPVLTWGPDDVPLTDAKPRPEHLAAWATAVAVAGEPHVSLFAGLVAEGGLDRSGTSKPSHLHFTAGQQRFLTMVREILVGLDADRLREAVVGPWRYDSHLPSLSWDARGERLYALRGSDPSKEQRSGIPGADALGILGLRFYPVAVVGGRLVTSACNKEWKASAFRWPLWGEPLSARVVRSLVVDQTVVGGRRQQPVWLLRLRGVQLVLEAPIRRSDQGGYGSFGAADVLAEVAT